jgi:RNA polymerase sigma-70 factor (ECF subfamily)
MSDHVDDVVLLGEWRAGNAGAGELLFLRHFRPVYRFFETKFPADADELVQATFLACVGAKHRLIEGSSFRAYLFTIARHTLYRAITDRQRALGRIDFEVSSIEALVPTPGTRIDVRRERARLLEALRAMPVDVQMLLELHYWQGVRIGELAVIFEATEVAIRSRLHRARAGLRARMATKVDVAGKIGETLEDFDVWARGVECSEPVTTAC